MRRIAIALVLLTATASTAAADSALVDKLRGESASLWDVGMMRLRLQAQDAAQVMTKEAAGKTTHEVAFRADSGRVIVEFRILNPISST
jgi:hypothetical protein